MRILSFLILIVFLFYSGLSGDSPHGTDFKITCSNCHSSVSWKLDRTIYSFDHNSTKLPLTGQHVAADCKLCHPTLIFSDAKPECINCHEDVHQLTTGFDCARCHNSFSWLVSNIYEIHQKSRFPLLGAHRIADCSECHKSESSVRFEVIASECIDCHRDSYLATSSPNHVISGFSEDCSSCHPINANQWSGAGFSHNFFPLLQAHAIQCADCHIDTEYRGLSPDCTSCHQEEFQNVESPDHVLSGFPANCRLCHNLNPGWKPASYRIHDSESFPIYSGKHKGEWEACSDCHTNSTNYNVFSCLNCHEHNKAKMDDEHSGKSRYSYVSAECLRCHPNGNED